MQSRRDQLEPIQAERIYALAQLLTVALGEPEDVASDEAFFVAEYLAPLIWPSSEALSPERQEILERLFGEYRLDLPPI